MAFRMSARGCVTAMLVLALWAGAYVSAPAQVIFGTVVGTVSDPSGAPVEGATIRAISSATNEARTTTSSGAGTYSIPNMQPGAYRLEVELPGFK